LDGLGDHRSDQVGRARMRGHAGHPGLGRPPLRPSDGQPDRVVSVSVLPLTLRVPSTLSGPARAPTILAGAKTGPPTGPLATGPGPRAYALSAPCSRDRRRVRTTAAAHSRRRPPAPLACAPVRRRRWLRPQRWPPPRARYCWRRSPSRSWRLAVGAWVRFKGPRERAPRAHGASGPVAFGRRGSPGDGHGSRGSPRPLATPPLPLPPHPPPPSSPCRRDVHADGRRFHQPPGPLRRRVIVLGLPLLLGACQPHVPPRPAFLLRARLRAGRAAAARRARRVPQARDAEQPHGDRERRGRGQAAEARAQGRDQPQRRARRARPDRVRRHDECAGPAPGRGVGCGAAGGGRAVRRRRGCEPSPPLLRAAPAHPHPPPPGALSPSQWSRPAATASTPCAPPAPAACACSRRPRASRRASACALTTKWPSPSAPGPRGSTSRWAPCLLGLPLRRRARARACEEAPAAAAARFGRWRSQQQRTRVGASGELRKREALSPPSPAPPHPLLSPAACQDRQEQGPGLLLQGEVPAWPHPRAHTRGSCPDSLLDCPPQHAPLSPRPSPLRPRRAALPRAASPPSRPGSPSSRSTCPTRPPAPTTPASKCGGGSSTPRPWTTWCARSAGAAAAPPPRSCRAAPAQPLRHACSASMRGPLAAPLVCAVA
jgi:hypothetical protein